MKVGLLDSDCIIQRGMDRSRFNGLNGPISVAHESSQLLLGINYSIPYTTLGIGEIETKYDYFEGFGHF